MANTPQAKPKAVELLLEEWQQKPYVIDIMSIGRASERKRFFVSAEGKIEALTSDVTQYFAYSGLEPLAVDQQARARGLIKFDSEVHQPVGSTRWGAWRSGGSKADESKNLSETALDAVRNAEEEALWSAAASYWDACSALVGRLNGKVDAMVSALSKHEAE